MSDDIDGSPKSGSSKTATSALPEVAGIIVAAGQGTRYGAPDKVLLPLGGRPVLSWALEAFSASLVSEIVIVVREHIRATVEALLTARQPRIPVRVVVGGERRQDSVARGVAAASDAITLVAIHDAARPLVSTGLIDRTIERALVSRAAIAACPVTDTLKRIGEDFVVMETVSRVGLWAAQTPQVFDRELLALASQSPVFRDETFTDEAALFEKLGHPVMIVPNHEPNPKVTHPGDLAVIEALLAAPLARGERPR